MENVVEPPEAIIVIQLINVHVPTSNHQMKKKILENKSRYHRTRHPKQLFHIITGHNRQQLFQIITGHNR